MTKNALSLIAGLILLPIAANSQPPAASSILSGSIQALRGAGYAGMEDAQVPPAPTAAPASSSSSDQTKDPLAALISATQSEGGLIPETAKALGFEFDGNSFPSKNYDSITDQDSIRHFSVAAKGGKTVIVIQEYSKAAKEMRSYRASSTGILEAAAVTTKADGKFHAVAIPLPNSEASTKYQAQLAFWIQYSHDHITH